MVQTLISSIMLLGNCSKTMYNVKVCDICVTTHSEYGIATRLELFFFEMFL